MPELLFRIVRGQAVERFDQHDVARGVLIRGVAANPVAVKRIIDRLGAVRNDLLGDDLVAVGAREHRRQNLDLALIIGDTDHVRRVGEIIERGLHRVDFLLRHCKLTHVTLVHVQLAVHHVDVLGEEVRRLDAFRLGDAHGVGLGIVLEIQEVLHDVVAELITLQRAVLDAEHKGVLVVGVPDRFAGVQQSFRCFHLVFSLANSPRRSKLCCMGPAPLPRSSIADSAPEMYSFARATDSLSE